MPFATTSRLVGEKTFCETDQERFAAVSGDINPMHMDAIAARRLMTGKQVVHGIHVFLSALEVWQHDGKVFPASMDCNFNNPISVGERVCFMQHRGDDGKDIIEATVNGLVCAQVSIATLNEPPSPAPSLPPSGVLPTVLEHLSQPLDEQPSSQANKAYRVELGGGDHASQFPTSCRLLGKHGVAAIASLSYFVGMVCPGLHSVFSSFMCRLSSASADQGFVDFFVRKYDARFRLFDIAFDGCLQGGIRAFLRAPPQVQPTVHELTAIVQAGEFLGTRALVIGGSRGLGELTAKILAAGGGHVTISYASGAHDARRIQDEITASGKGECRVLKLDLTSDRLDLAELDWAELDAVYFFATPRIFRKKFGHFETELFNEFCLYYLTRFYDLCLHLERHVSGRKVKVYVPSSVAITDRPKGIAEYAMAKAAAEILFEEINRNFKNVSVFSSRLPRLNTDQTATIFMAASESNVEIMLPIIRSLQH